jgi:uncharacterized cupin superfamily protein
VARPRTVDSRFDARGGVATSLSDDVLDLTEVKQAKNGRSYTQGAWDKRCGTQRLHTTQLEAGAVVNGVHLWKPSANEAVAICNGHLFYKAYAAADYTKVASTLNTTGIVRWARWRSGATIQLYFVDGTTLRRWDGAVLTTSFTSAPSTSAKDLTLFKLRMFVAEGKRLSWSKRGDPSLWGSGNGGGYADIETFDAEDIVGVIKVGSSILIAKQNNIARYTGISSEDIKIDTEQEGVSATVGAVGVGTFITLDEAGFTLSDRGPYLVTESGVQPVDLKIGKEFDLANRAQMASAIAEYHRGRREVWLSMAASGESTNLTTWILNLRTLTWSGPFVFPFAVRSLARYEQSDGTESIQVGGTDGWTRDLDVRTIAAKDDLLKGGTGGTNVALTLEYPPLLGSEPAAIKAVRSAQALSADLKASGSVTATWSSEMGSGSVTIASAGAGMKSYPFKWNYAKGRRIVRTLTEATDQLVTIAGIQSPVSTGRKAHG